MSTQLPRTSSAIVALRKREGAWVNAFRQALRSRSVVVGGAIVVLIILVAILADVIAIRPYAAQTLQDGAAMPGWFVSLIPALKGYARVNDAYPLGADQLGRDVFSRIVYGTRVSVAVAIVAPLMALLIGTVYGSLSGYFGGRVDNLMMRLVDAVYGFPNLLLLILILAAFRSAAAEAEIEPGSFRYMINALDQRLGGLLFVFFGIGLTAWVSTARLARGQALAVRERVFVEAAHAMGASHARIVFRHILPNIAGVLIVTEALAVPGYISSEAFLSFLGLGVSPPTPSWGLMMIEGMDSARTYPHIILFPSLALALVMLAFNLVGDGLRDVFDPHLRDRL